MAYSEEWHETGMLATIQCDIACGNRVQVTFNESSPESSPRNLALREAGRYGWSLWEGRAACPGCVRRLVIAEADRLALEEDEAIESIRIAAATIGCTPPSTAYRSTQAG